MERISEYYEYDQEYKLDEQQQLFYENTTTNDEKVAAVVGHEIEHAVDEGNYDLHGSEREEVPEQIETSILREIPRTKRVNIASMPIYSESFTPSVTLMNEKQ